MSIRKVIVCDGPLCEGLEGAEFDHEPLPHETAAEQRVRAIRAGWITTKSGKDFCSNCVEHLGLE